MNNLKLITSGQRFAFCSVSSSPLRKEANDAAEMVSQLLFGEPLKVVQIHENWIEIETYFDAYSGWMDIKHALAISEKEMRIWLNQLRYAPISSWTLSTPWGNQMLFPASFVGEDSFHIGTYLFTLQTKVDNVRKSPFELALSYLNSPYLWGGKSISGTDCSGLVQSVFRIYGINLPRDAYQQEETGSNVEFDQHKEDDLAFFSNAQRKIIHVGIIGKSNQIIHASGRVRIDTLRKEGVWNEDQQLITHNLHSIKRLS